jgi:hypothetical protein
MKTVNTYFFVTLAITVIAAFGSCDDDDDAVEIYDVNTAEKVSVDRFSSTAGHLMIRDASNGLPAANAPINFDQLPFITIGKGPTGENVEYYNFDIQPVDPAPIYVFFKEGSDTPVPNQLNIINVLPGETGYNDFWLVTKVTVPASYQANEVASFDEIQARGYPTEATTTIVNCPVVPEGSTATKRIGGGSAELMAGWHKEKIVYYFTFEEKAITASGGKVPVSPIYVCFNINADEAGGGPPSGFKVEPGTMQTHNVVATVPANGSYSPLWAVSAYDNVEFDDVMDLSSAQSAAPTGLGATVNCPVVTIE